MPRKPSRPKKTSNTKKVAKKASKKAAAKRSNRKPVPSRASLDELAAKQVVQVPGEVIAIILDERRRILLDFASTVEQFAKFSREATPEKIAAPCSRNDCRCHRCSLGSLAARARAKATLLTWDTDACLSDKDDVRVSLVRLPVAPVK